jgi:ribosomal protein S18 acetylase RimI-like enzyme
VEQEVRYRLVDASSADEVWLDDLRRQAYADLFDATWGGWDEARHARHFAESMRRGHISIIMVGGVRVGMLQLMVRGETVEICEVQIEPTHQNRGIGSAVLLDILARADEQGRTVRLSVGLSNQKAMRLYERLGFSSEGQSDTHCHLTHQGSG